MYLEDRTVRLQLWDTAGQEYVLGVIWTWHTKCLSLHACHFSTQWWVMKMLLILNSSVLYIETYFFCDARHYASSLFPPHHNTVCFSHSPSCHANAQKFIRLFALLASLPTTSCPHPPSRRFRTLIPSYIRDSSVAVIVYDITSMSLRRVDCMYISQF